MSFDILTASKNITRKYVRYLNTMFDIDDPDYKRLFEARMNEMGSFSKGPYLDVVDSFKAGSSVQDLIKEGILDPDFQYLKDIYAKTLYKHQEISVRKLKAGKNVVVSTGTGSGKTESFLVPILNSLMEEKREKGKLTPGVRALLIYPMNALANDQISRLRSVLADYPYITFGSYTGQTEEHENKALSKYMSLNGGRRPLKNELISREKMKNQPPNILVTNYSMLEYLMLRPKDNSFFQGKYSNNWRFVVLDEAHTYSGSTGIEVSMLLRRLKAYLDGADIRFILTSATLGGENANDEVAQFAERLCGAPFYGEDVVRAHRIDLVPHKNEEISLSAEDYLELNDIVESGYDDNHIKELLERYLRISEESSDYSEYLFDVLLRDKTYWKVKNFLKTPKTVRALSKEMEWGDKEISAFVNVASKAMKDRKKLFDSRYHMFIRATEGVFITLGKNKDLSLSRKNYETKDGEQYKYFEAVTCTQCHSIYLLGKIEEDEQGRKYLKQSSNTLGDNIREAFLLGNVVSDNDDDNLLEDEHLKVKNYELCPHCGFIRERDLAHKTCCEHSEKDYVELIKVSQSERTGRVTKCIKCEGINYTGILRSFFSGQEASTSVIGTALFEELPDKEAKVVDIALPINDGSDGFDDGFDDGFGEPINSNQMMQKAKQFIAFSDNRQAAAFFATYFYETYQGFLYSRIVYENVKKAGMNGKPLVNFVKDMSMDFRNHGIFEMFDENPDYLKESWKAILKEIISSYSRNSLIGLGLLSLDFNDNVIMRDNKKYRLSSDEIRTMCLVMMRSMFEDNAIYHGQSFTDSDLAFFTNNGASSTYVLANPANKYIKSFVPKTDTTTNKRIDYIERVFHKKGLEVKREDTIGFMSGLWNRIMIPNGLIKDDVSYNGMVADISKLQVCGGDKKYRCSKCHRITSYNIEGVCPAYRCDGQLEEIDIRDFEKDNHYYRIYNSLDMHPLRVVEHTAQLSSEEAYKLQEKFKNQEIDVLSCSTTFEMGVDIGDLETVFMRNMPPTPSNYVQRAGRAGRSVKSAALALTFCNKSNHDFSYFNDPIGMINGEIQPPLFKVENEKIGIRHLYSAAIAFFWRKYPVFFGTSSDFFGDEEEGIGYYKLKEYLESKPEDLKEYLKKAFPETLLLKFEIETYGWVKWLFDEPLTSYPNLKNVFEQYREEVTSLYFDKRQLEKDNKSNYAVINRINTFTKENIISFLSRNNILPKYGFPVDTVELQVAAEKNNKVLGIDLSRDLSMAISEYAPGCEVIAAGNKITSRYIKKRPSKAWREYDYVQCDDCHTLNIKIHHDAEDFDKIERCEQCGKEFRRSDIRTFLIPEFGFTSEAKVVKPTLIKPEKTYRSEASMVAKGSTLMQGDYDIGQLHVKTVCMEDGEVAVLNKSNFYVCSSCGYSLGDFEANTLSPTLKKEHKKSSGYKCANSILRKYSLGYRFKTDALSISMDDCYTYEEAYSILQAIILSACNTLNIDNNEIAGCLQYTINSFGYSFDFIIYDTTPGGAGHVRRFTDESTIKKVLLGAYSKANNCDCGGAEGDSSCYRCLRTYQNQHYHDMLKRKYVIEKLGKLL